MTRSPRIILAAAAVAAVAQAAAALAAPALMAKPAATDRAVTPAAAAGTTIYACLTSRHTLVRVSVTTPPACPVGTVPVQWQGQAGQPVPTPSASPTSKSAALGSSPTATSPSPGRPPAGAACVRSAHSRNCGPYAYPPISNSNWYTTYVGNNMWGCRPDTTPTTCGPQPVAPSHPHHRPPPPTPPQRTTP